MEPNKKNWLDLELKEFPQPEFVPLKYPVLLCHGFGALASLVTPTHLHSACMFLREHGVPAIAPNIAPYAEIEIGAAAWVRIAAEVLKITKAAKLNIIAHSMAGLSIRYALSKMSLSDVVTSLTTVATPHHGTCLAEMALETPEIALDLFTKYSDRLGNAVYPHIPSNINGALQQLTREYITHIFNPEISDVAGISYYSISAGTGKNTGTRINVILAPYNRYIFKREGINDGFVSESSARWGQHLECVNLSHMEQIKLNLPKKKVRTWENMWLGIVKRLSADGH